MALGLLLAVAVTLDIRWLKNRHKVLNEVYVAPVYVRMKETSSAVPGSGTPYALDNRLAEAEAIGSERSKDRKTSSSIAMTISIVALGMARSFGSLPPTTDARRCSRMLAGFLSVWHSIDPRT